MNSKYSTGSALNVVVSTRLLILNSCTGTCQFTYIESTSSPALTSSSKSSVSPSGTGTVEVVLTGTNVQDSNNFAEVSLKNTVSSVTTVLPATASTATSLTFEVPATVQSGSYTMKIRNAVG